MNTFDNLNNMNNENYSFLNSPIAGNNEMSELDMFDIGNFSLSEFNLNGSVNVTCNNNINVNLNEMNVGNNNANNTNTNNKGLESIESLFNNILGNENISLNKNPYGNEVVKSTALKDLNLTKNDMKVEEEKKSVAVKKTTKKRGKKRKLVEVANIEDDEEEIVVDKSLSIKEQKKYRRKMQNRRSARLSRERKKMYVNSLEEKVKTLAESNDELQKELMDLKKKLRARYQGPDQCGPDQNDVNEHNQENDGNQLPLIREAETPEDPEKGLEDNILSSSKQIRRTNQNARRKLSGMNFGGACCCEKANNTEKLHKDFHQNYLLQKKLNQHHRHRSSSENASSDNNQRNNMNYKNIKNIGFENAFRAFNAQGMDHFATILGTKTTTTTKATGVDDEGAELNGDRIIDGGKAKPTEEIITRGDRPEGKAVILEARLKLSELKGIKALAEIARFASSSSCSNNASRALQPLEPLQALTVMPVMASIASCCVASLVQENMMGAIIMTAMIIRTCFVSGVCQMLNNVVIGNFSGYVKLKPSLPYSN